MKKVFLGGTCNNSTWRDELIPNLHIGYYNPVVPDWTPECEAEELKQREECDFCLYVITNEMEGFYSIAEVIDDSNKRPEKTIFCWLQYEKPFTPKQRKSLKAIEDMIIRNGGTVCDTLDDIANYLNLLK